MLSYTEPIPKADSCCYTYIGIDRALFYYNRALKGLYREKVRFLDCNFDFFSIKRSIIMRSYTISGIAPALSYGLRAFKGRGH